MGTAYYTTQGPEQYPTQGHEQLGQFQTWPQVKWYDSLLPP